MRQVLNKNKMVVFFLYFTYKQRFLHLVIKIKFKQKPYKVNPTMFNLS